MHSFLSWAWTAATTGVGFQIGILAVVAAL